MKKRLLHSTDVAVSSLGLGTVKFGRNEVVKYPEGFELPTDEEILSLLDLAQEEGINLIDTAPAYGTSEERLGGLLGSRRDDWAIVSKAGEEFENGVSRFDFSGRWIRQSVERSLNRLRTDRLEAVLLHSDGNDVEILQNTDSLEVLQQLKDEGKIRAYGISTKTAEGGILAVELGFDIVMVTYNPWHREEEAVLDAATAKGTSIFLKKALSSGWFGGEEKPEDPVATSLSFVFSHPATTAAIVGTINPAHLKANCETIRQIENQT